MVKAKKEDSKKKNIIVLGAILLIALLLIIFTFDGTPDQDIKGDNLDDDFYESGNLEGRVTVNVVSGNNGGGG